jgi:hypothetical protein
MPKTRPPLTSWPQEKQWDEARSLLIEEIDCGFFDGGCLILAKALTKILPGAQVATITVRGQPDHYVVALPDGWYADADGLAENGQALLRRYHEAEARMEPFEDLALHDKIVPNKVTPRDAQLSHKLAEILQPTRETEKPQKS